MMLFFVTVLACVCPAIHAHGLLSFPNQRGALRTSRFIPHGVNETGVEDFYKHFPAGDKSLSPGSGVRSQRRAAGRSGWTLFAPLSRQFVWRSGVCGDPLRLRAHVSGGRFYNGGRPVATFRQGGILRPTVSIVAHHNGFFQFFLCDVARCTGPDISKRCMQTLGACHALRRVGTASCLTGGSASMRCGPVHTQYPTRWYLPCTTLPLGQTSTFEQFGGSDGTLVYRLPRFVTCTHCVVVWYWAAANACNAPGLVQYFNGTDRPRWGSCRGQGGAVGGIARWLPTCGGPHFPEEYVQCADIEILPVG